MPGPGRIEVDEDLIDHFARSSGACGIAVVGDAVESAEQGLRIALRDVVAIPHPDEPAEPLVKFISDIKRTNGDGVGVVIDAPDIAVAELTNVVIAALKRGLERAGVHGRLVGVSVTDLVDGDEPDRPQPWNGSDLPDWLPLPTDAVDVRAVFSAGDGYVEFWTPSSPRQSFDFFATALPGAGFELGEAWRTEHPDHDGVEEYSLEFSGQGRNCKLQNGFRRRTCETNAAVVEIKVNIRCDLAPASA